MSTVNAPSWSPFEDEKLSWDVKCSVVVINIIKSNFSHSPVENWGTSLLVRNTYPTLSGDGQRLLNQYGGLEAPGPVPTHPDLDLFFHLFRGFFTTTSHPALQAQQPLCPGTHLCLLSWVKNTW